MKSGKSNFYQTLNARAIRWCDENKPPRLKFVADSISPSHELSRTQESFAEL